MERWYESNILYHKIRAAGLIDVIKYLIVGGIAAIVDLLLLYLFMETYGLHYLVSNTLSFIVATTVNYYIGVVIMFKPKNAHREMTLVFMVSVGALMVSSLVMYVGISLMGLHYLIAKITSQIVGFIWNYLGRKRYIYKAVSETKDREESFAGNHREGIMKI